jgi:low temperature requirement protein LtrA
MSRGGRRLFGETILLQDWDRLADEGAAQYWELFLDLLLVAAASCLADQYKEDENFGEFVQFYLILVNGWALYTHHITSRFEDASLAHSMLLFVFFVGFGYSSVNVGLEHASAFAAGALLQRVSVLIMLANTAYCLPRARYFCGVLAILIGFAMIGLGVACWGGERMALTGLLIAAIIESFGEAIMSRFIDGHRLVPVNIEHTKDRLGALELVMLGETALSVTLTYREVVAREDIVHGTENDYYWVLGLSFLLIFMFTLLLFHMQPAPSEHAFRRSRYHGVGVFLAHKILGLCLLAVGVSIKLVVDAVLLQEDLLMFGYRLMGWGSGSALFLLFVIRYLHHGGKTELRFGNKVWVHGQNPDTDRVAALWWWTIGIAWLLPFVGIATGVTTRDPLSATTMHAALLFLLCLIESFYSHTIEVALSNLPDAEGERQPLVGPHATH